MPFHASGVDLSAEHQDQLGVPPMFPDFCGEVPAATAAATGGSSNFDYELPEMPDSADDGGGDDDLFERVGDLHGSWAETLKAYNQKITNAFPAMKCASVKTGALQDGQVHGFFVFFCHQRV